MIFCRHPMMFLQRICFLPKEVLYALPDRMRRAAMSIPSKTHENSSCFSNREGGRIVFDVDDSSREAAGIPKEITQAKQTELSIEDKPDDERKGAEKEPKKSQKGAKKEPKRSRRKEPKNGAEIKTSILQRMQEDPAITKTKLMEEFELTRKQIQSMIKNLQKNGLVER